MTLQQLQYIISVEHHRSFAKAAESCGITQPTLSKMIANLEEELGIKIFYRSSRHVSLTETGQAIIRQAVKTVMEAERIKEIVAETKDTVSGELRLSIGPTIAPYVLPEFIKKYSAANPSVRLSIEEMRIVNMADALLDSRIDAAIAIGGNRRDGIFEIELYEEPFWVYLSPECMRQYSEFTSEQLSHENMWIMKEAQCLRESAFSFCKARETGRRVYEAGNIDTLIRVVDTNGGFTIIPEMHLPLLTDRQRKQVRPLSGATKSGRKISIYIRSDYVREKLLQSIISALKAIIPNHLISPYILKYAIRL